MSTTAREFITQNRLFEAIQEMRKLPLRKPDKTALTNMESRLNALNEKVRLGVLSEDQTNLELNKIRVGLLDICEELERPTEEEGSVGLLKKGLVALCLLLPAAYFLIPSAEEACTDSKVAILVADFQNIEMDGFSNTLIVNMDHALEDERYDVSPVGAQERTARYDDFIKEKYFAASCDSTGLFVNGLLSPEQEVFNAYVTIAGLEMEVPGFSKEKSINLANPQGLEFSIPGNAQFLANLLLGIIRSYEGKPYEALHQFFDLEKEAGKNNVQQDKNFQATIAHFKGNCYAMRGDEERASEQYRIVRKNGSPELVRVANQNNQLAIQVNTQMQEDPELKLQLEKNISEHATFELELAKILDKVGKGFKEGVSDIFKGFK